MGLFSFLRGKRKMPEEASSAVEPSQSAIQELSQPVAQSVSPVFEQEVLERNTGRLMALCELSRDARDAEWRKEFLALAPLAAFAPDEPQVFQGPDGFPYIKLLIPRWCSHEID